MNVSAVDRSRPRRCTVEGRSEHRDDVGASLRALDVGAGRLQRTDVVRGAPGHVLRVLGKICVGAKNEYLACVGRSGGDDLPIGAVEDQWAVLRTLAHRGVVSRRIVAGAGGRALPFPESGVADTAVADRLPLSMAIIDRSIAVVPLDLDRFWAGFAVISQPLVVAAFVAQFESLWEALDGADPDRRPPERFRGLLDVLGSGLADAPAARRLRVAPRTFSRRVAELLLELRADSRFQAGAEAARRGWI